VEHEVAVEADAPPLALLGVLVVVVQSLAPRPYPSSDGNAIAIVSPGTTTVDRQLIDSAAWALPAYKPG
jgi:hypothetical protein